ncbi:MAG: hypothetical protein QNL12_07880 [Acidimicrobiia bacterium]|nr:hypothetical protein [Acidimicrobiia bacterium]MDX2467217.1 hypothetical protein [Acidimicrobiia bacterium]
MFDGVGWAAGEIVIFMLIATLIGLAIGWIFGRWLQKGTIATSYEAELAEQRELTKKAESRLGQSNKNLDEVHLDLKGERAKVAQLTTEVEEAQVSVGTREADLAASAEKDAEIERLTAELVGKSDLEAQLAAAGDVHAELGRLKEELAACGTERDGLTTRISKLENDLAMAGGEHEALTDRLAALEADIASRDDDIALLRADLESAAQSAPEPPAVVEREPEVVAPLVASAVTAEPTQEEGLSRIAEIAARTAGDGPVADDDLKKVHGIGPKLEGTLKGLGITSFRQIANFQADDIMFVTAALDAFKGRIERDDWMASAAEEHAKKYNEPA